MVKGQLPLQKVDCFCRKRHKKTFQHTYHSERLFLIFNFLVKYKPYFLPLVQLLIIFPLWSFRLMTNPNAIRRTYHTSFYFMADNPLYYLECSFFDFSVFFHFTHTSCFIIFAKHIKNAHNMIATDI